jgi:hypothetical protein
MPGLFSVTSKKMPLIPGLIFLIGLNYFTSPTWAESALESRIDPERVRWSQLSYQAHTFVGKVSVAVQLGFISASEAQRALIVSPRGIPISIESHRAGYITVRRTVDPTFGSKITEEDTVWFNPKQAGAFGRTRLRRGIDDFLKRYRFTDQGVYRIQKEPADQKEVELSPDKWTDVGEKFYAYDLKQLGCPMASERSILFFVASAAPFSANREPLSLCAFGKRQLHRVRLNADGFQSLKVEYVEKNQHNEAPRKSTVKALKIILDIRPMDSELNEVENFSLLGLRKDIVIFMDPISLIPVQVSGKLPRLGTMNFKLSEVLLRRITD